MVTLKSSAKFVKITSSGISESHPHNVMITKEAPNYRAEWDGIQRTNRKLGREFFQLRLAIWPLDRFADRVAPYPWGKNWAAAIYLLNIGEELTAAIDDLDPVIDAVVMELESNDGSPIQLTDRLKQSYMQMEERFVEISIRNKQIVTNMGKLDHLGVNHSWLADQTKQLQKLLPIAQTGLLSMQALY